jgi:acyl transferase domain-containing protein
MYHLKNTFIYSSISQGIVAGCSLILRPDLTIGMSNMGFLSPDGVCHSFDSRANGYARGEGFGVVIIKPIMDAIRDGDTIRSVIRATRSNQDGKTGLAQPSKYAQIKLIDDTYQFSKLNRSLTGYVEAHGTGTGIGDPLEAQALGAALGAYRPSHDPLYV